MVTVFQAFKTKPSTSLSMPRQITWRGATHYYKVLLINSNHHHFQYSYLLCGLIQRSSSSVLNSLSLRSEHIINCISVSSAADQTLWNVTTGLRSRYRSSVVLSSSHRSVCNSGYRRINYLKSFLLLMYTHTRSSSHQMPKACR